ncbi:hypothetical protein [Limosilactobacillus pontis]|uniref:Uncharacterized protein n=1 Tax=Limosilactobacillus pontis DSM 8475 TaxID=1423794 RepID=A0A922PVR5_9LACO|nr:hypothetical protein [Limosilactobacillus pontis]KRM37610.1 hypothetical protein FD34_GL001230 [Limosilactobacillus pontis DSM 8475]QFV01156.1 hypothetical protein LP475_05285 [Limosilactobacillus pontis]
MQTSYQGGFFISSADPAMVTAVAEVDDGCGLVLNPTGAHVDVRQLAGELAGHRLLLPLTVTTSRQMRRQAEELSLLGDNAYVQVPVMTAGQFNTALIHDLLAEGVPLAVTGLATRQAVKRVLDQAVASQTPLLLMMSAATAYYDLIVSTALAHLFPTVQLVVGAPNQLAILRAQRLAVDGVNITADQLAIAQEPVVGAACQL